jgi:hypothetical protein
MMMPTKPCARFIMIQTDFSFSFLQGRLHWPAQPTDADEFTLRTGGHTEIMLIFGGSARRKRSRPVDLASPAEQWSHAQRRTRDQGPSPMNRRTRFERRIGDRSDLRGRGMPRDPRCVLAVTRLRPGGSTSGVRNHTRVSAGT